jgi:RloB-like protein
LSKARSRAVKSLRRGKPKKLPYDRILIVCEGKKTEPNYFEEIRILARLAPVYVKVVHSGEGTQPDQVVESAINEFQKTKEFDKVYAVFDRDDHPTYANAIHKADAHKSKLRNDERKTVEFNAIVSVPCFELWLLLHFENIAAHFHRDEIFQRLRKHLPGYAKNANDTFSKTQKLLETATERALRLRGQFQRLPGNDPYTDVDLLVATLKPLVNK